VTSSSSERKAKDQGIPPCLRCRTFLRRNLFFASSSWSTTKPVGTASRSTPTATATRFCGHCGISWVRPVVLVEEVMPRRVLADAGDVVGVLRFPWRYRLNRRWLCPRPGVPVRGWRHTIPRGQTWQGPPTGYR